MSVKTVASGKMRSKSRSTSYDPPSVTSQSCAMATFTIGAEGGGAMGDGITASRHPDPKAGMLSNGRAREMIGEARDYAAPVLAVLRESYWTDCRHHMEEAESL